MHAVQTQAALLTTQPVSRFPAAAVIENPVKLYLDPVYNRLYSERLQCRRCDLLREMLRPEHVHTPAVGWQYAVRPSWRRWCTRGWQDRSSSARTPHTHTPPQRGPDFLQLPTSTKVVQVSASD